MPFQLKYYQERCLQVLQGYLSRVAEVGPKRAFDERDDLPLKYQSIPQLTDLPYVCLRLPTGGGKTILACCSVRVVAANYLQQDRCVVLWLAPTNAIVDQTLRALRDRSHPYRQVLDRDFLGNIEIFSLTEALNVTRGILEGATTIIVATLAALRVDDMDGRKVYETSGALQHHFSGLADSQVARLEKTDGAYAFSLANVLRMRRPLVIMDEAHNARTPLSFETLTRFSPSCILEFTATPDKEKNPSNVLVSVSAVELKAEQMVKLPIRLVSRAQWKEAVQEAVAKQRHLENLAREEEKLTGEYIRPIVLFQAQPHSEKELTITTEELRKCLLEDFKISKEEIAMGTGKEWEVPDNLQARVCPVKFVLTVSKLREGWDCPFAYVLCSVSNLSSRGAVEQILGRILRLPDAKPKQHGELNLAYAFATSQRFIEAAESLKDALIESGFDKFDARRFVESAERQLEFGITGPLFSEKVEETEFFEQAPPLDRLPIELRNKLTLQPPVAGRLLATVTYVGPPMTAREEDELKTVIERAEDLKAVERLVLRTRGFPVFPAAMGEQLAVPYLAVRVGEQLEVFEEQYREAPWNLADCDPSLSESEFSLTGPTAQVGIVDVNESGQVFYKQVEELHEQLNLLEVRGPRTESELIEWLDRAIEHRDISQAQSTEFLRKMLDHLSMERHIALEHLVRVRFRLRDAAREKIARHRRDADSTSFQRFLFPEERSPVVVSPRFCFEFPDDPYPAPSSYAGPIKFRKHFYEQPADMNDEEAACALLIDSLQAVKYWVRNLTRPDYAFWLQTSSDKFYPDFVAQLRDGRYLVVEYKGADRMDSADTKEKKMVGELWEARSGGRCIFRLVGRENMDSVLREAVATREEARGTG